MQSVLVPGVNEMVRSTWRLRCLRRTLYLSVLLILIGRSFGLAANSEFAGSDACRDCHETQYLSWRSSHHHQAMQIAGRDSVLGNFENVMFTHLGSSSRFYRRAGEYFVTTDGPDGKSAEFKIAYTFGFYPLQQYLVGFRDGRYQALSIAWDSRPVDAGGQRWFHLYPDEAIDHQDPLHWTGFLFNWNSRCAVCHSTGFEKNYDLDFDLYQSRFSEVSVGCEACHGPAATHLAWAANPIREEGAGKGLLLDLGRSGNWSRPADHDTASLTGMVTKNAELDVCAPCHARRELHGTPVYGQEILQIATPRLLSEGFYHPDGQIMDEVYVYGSFLSSRMYQAGVTCTDCHQPHSTRLKASGNQLCTQCHSPDHFDRPEHHHHSQGEPGSQCVECHMPQTTYMVVDPRRDHSFRIPAPRLAEQLGVPNVCSGCHDEDIDALTRQWAISTDHRQFRWASAFLRARANDAAAVPLLIAIAQDDSSPAIVRATALEELRRYPSGSDQSRFEAGLNSDDALVRLGAVLGLESSPATARRRLLEPLVTDPVLSVRLAVAAQLLELFTNDKPGLERYRSLFDELKVSLDSNRDMPEVLLRLGAWHAILGSHQDAELAYRRALQIAPSYIPAYLNLADFYRATGREAEAGVLLTEATRLAPDVAAVHHSLGLHHVRTGQLHTALGELALAVGLDSAQVRYAYVYSVALMESDRIAEAIIVAQRALDAHPHNRDLLNALASYYQQQGDVENYSRIRSRLMDEDTDAVR